LPVKKVVTFRPAMRASRKERFSVARQEAKNFYSSTPWRRLRAAYLDAHPLCVDCRKRNWLTEATEVHHIVKREADPSLALEWSNLEGLCKACHSRRTGKGE
jgi:5-methylcytosine-specific restriction enzyme A